ncbi:hypothetical protein D3C80_1515630 [compost metagenome]
MVAGESTAQDNRPFSSREKSDGPYDSCPGCVMIGVYAVAGIECNHDRRFQLLQHVQNGSIQQLLVLELYHLVMEAKHS